MSLRRSLYYFAGMALAAVAGPLSVDLYDRRGPSPQPKRSPHLIKRSRYMPHQSKREMERRRRQMQKDEVA